MLRMPESNTSKINSPFLVFCAQLAELPENIHNYIKLAEKIMV